MKKLIKKYQPGGPFGSTVSYGENTFSADEKGNYYYNDGTGRFQIFTPDGERWFKTKNENGALTDQMTFASGTAPNINTNYDNGTPVYHGYFNRGQQKLMHTAGAKYRLEGRALKKYEDKDWVNDGVVDMGELRRGQRRRIKRLVRKDRNTERAKQLLGKQSTHVSSANSPTGASFNSNGELRGTAAPLNSSFTFVKEGFVPGEEDKNYWNNPYTFNKDKSIIKGNYTTDFNTAKNYIQKTYNISDGDWKTLFNGADNFNALAEATGLADKTNITGLSQRKPNTPAYGQKYDNAVREYIKGKGYMAKDEKGNPKYYVRPSTQEQIIMQ